MKTVIWFSFKIFIGNIDDNIVCQLTSSTVVQCVRFLRCYVGGRRLDADIQVGRWYFDCLDVRVASLDDKALDLNPSSGLNSCLVVMLFFAIMMMLGQI